MQRKHFMAEAAKRLENMRDEDSESIGGHTSAMSIRKWYKKRTTIGRGKTSRARESKGYKRSLMGQR